MNLFKAYLVKLNLTYVILLNLCSLSPYKGVLPPSKPKCNQILDIKVTNFW